MEFVDSENLEELVLDIYPGNFSYQHFQDDGESFAYEEGEYNLYEFKVSSDEGMLIEVNKPVNNYKEYKKLVFKINNNPAKAVSVDGEAWPFQQEGDMIVFETTSDVKEIRIL